MLSEGLKSKEQRATEEAEMAQAVARLRATRAAERGLKREPREPDSLKRWVTLRANQSGTLVCGEYRARNGFGGMTPDYLVVSGGKPIEDKGAWNKHCVQRLLDVPDL